MKKFIMLWLIFFNGGAFGQQRQNTVVAEIHFNKQPARLQTKSDTVRAILLITVGHMTIAHQKPGYVVIHQRDTLYLDDRMRPLKAPVTVWNYKIKKQ